MADVSVEVARAMVHDDVEVEVVAPAEFKARAKGGVRIRYVYRFNEHTTEEETWTFRFTIRVNGGEPIVQEAVHEDRRGLHDHALKNLHVDVPLTPGDHDVQFTAEAHLDVVGKDGTRTRKKQAAGSLKIVAF